MKTKRIKAFLIAAIFAFESIAVGVAPIAQTVSENTVEKNAVSGNSTVKNAVIDDQVTSQKASVLPVSGKTANLNWSIDQSGCLTITGTGNYDNANAWLNYKAYITSAKVTVTGITDTSMMFYDCSKLKTIDISGLDTSKVTHMGFMFSGCSSLTSIDLSKMNTSNVVYMYDMFSDCSSLTSLNLNSFNTSKVVNMSYMFSGCSKLNNLDISSFRTDSAINMTYMFVDCHALETITVPANLKCAVDFPKKAGFGWKNSDGMVYAIAPLNVSKKVTYTLTKLAKTGTKLIDKSSGGKYKITSSSGDSQTVEYLGPTKKNKNKKKVTIPEYVAFQGVKYRVTSVAAKAFKGNKKLKNISIATSITKIGKDAFSGCSNLKTVTVGKSLETIGKNAFKNCKKLTKITIKSKKLKSVGKNALKGINKKCKIKVPKAKVKTYKKLFKKKGQAKTVKITK